MSDGSSPLYDLLFVPQDHTLALPVKAAQSLVRWLATIRIGRPYAEAVADKWVEVYMKPDASSHEIGVKGGWDRDEEVYKEMAVRIGSKPVALAYGVDCDRVCVFMEVRGTVLEAPIGSFLKKAGDVLKVRFDVYRRDHDGLTPHAEVGEDEQPKDKRRKPGDAGGKAGTLVEEW